MKGIVQLCVVLLGIATLTGCLGSGSGGSSGIARNDTVYGQALDAGSLAGGAAQDSTNPTPTSLTDAGVNQIVITSVLTTGIPVKLGSETNPTPSDLTLVSDGSSLKLMDASNQLVTQFDFGQDGIKKYENGLLVGIKAVGATELDFINNDPAPIPNFDRAGSYTNEKLPSNSDSNAPLYTGTVSYGQTAVLLNASMTPLQHSTFGAWAVDINYDGTMSDGSLDGKVTIAEYKPFAGGTSASVSISPANKTFTGGAVAQAYQLGNNIKDYKFAELAGTAKLSVQGATLGTLTLDFPDYYNVKYDLGIAGATIKGDPTATVWITDLGGAAKTGIDLRPEATVMDKGNNLVNASFYGNGVEAAGTFDFSGTPTDMQHGERGITGSFGVKQP